MLRTLIVDDHLIVRQGLKQLVEGGPDKVITADVCSSQEAVKALHEKAYDVVLLGVALSEIRSVELLKQVRAEKPALPVLILSVPDEEQYCSRLLRAGASGILSKDSAGGELLDAITKLSQGRKYVSPSLAESLADFSTVGNVPVSDNLSDREYEVMVSIASGKRMKQIADESSLSIKTVSTYHSRILQKLKLDNDAQLIRYALEQGVIRDNVLTREKLMLTEFNLRTAPMIGSIKEIWRQRKAIIICIGVLGVVAYLFLLYAIRFVF
jgi:two-component system invasion response regulator UvrY